MRILVAEDDPGLRFTVSDRLEEAGFDVSTAGDGDTAIRVLGNQPFDVVLTDLRLPGKGGLDVLKAAGTAAPRPSVIVMTGYGSIESAVEAMKLGAEDYVAKPFTMENILCRLEKVLRIRSIEEENRELKRLIAAQSQFEDLVGKSKAMREVYELVSTVAETDATVLILGESGTGKELVARAIHRRSPRRDGHFVAVNCTAIPESLFESEMFGFEKGAFTGAERRRIGKIEQADGGTLFFDEIAEMPAPFQAKLLRVLQERSFERIGGNDTVRVDTRIVSATNREDMKSLVERGDFREDLYYRLNVIAIRLPRLKDRREDIPLLVDRFAAGFRDDCRVSEDALACLMDHDFPGNVRELRNIVERATVLCGGGAIRPEHLPPEVSRIGRRTTERPLPVEEMLPLRKAVRRFELDYIRRVLDAVDGSRTRAAAILEIGRKALWERMRED